MFGSDIGIDLGTTNVVVYIQGRGIVMREPAVIAYDRDAEKILSCGEEAMQLIGHTPGNIAAVYPLKNGVISDYVMTEYLLRYFITRAIGRRGLLKPRIILSVPTRVTDVERRAVEEATYQAGAKDVLIVEGQIAAAIGAGIDINRPAGNMIVDIGGGITEIAVISLSEIAQSATIPIAGESFTEAIIRYVRRNHLLFIGEQTAESVKKSIGHANKGSDDRTIEIKGRNVFTGLPNRVFLRSSELSAPLKEVALRIADAVVNVIEQTTPEIAVDISKRGIILTGGGALLPGVDEVIAARTGIDTVTAPRPEICTASGTAKYLSVINKT